MWKDEKNPQMISNHDDFKTATRPFATAEHQEGQGHAYIPPKCRIRQKPIEEQLRSHFRWQCQNYQQVYGSQTSSSSVRQLGGNRNNGKNDKIDKNDKIGTNDRIGTNEFRHLDPPSHFANFFSCQSILQVDFAYIHQRMSCTRR